MEEDELDWITPYRCPYCGEGWLCQLENSWVTRNENQQIEQLCERE